MSCLIAFKQGRLQSLRRCLVSHYRGAQNNERDYNTLADSPFPGGPTCRWEWALEMVRPLKHIYQMWWCSATLSNACSFWGWPHPGYTPLGRLWVIAAKRSQRLYWLLCTNEEVFEELTEDLLCWLAQITHFAVDERWNYQIANFTSHPPRSKWAVLISTEDPARGQYNFWDSFAGSRAL